LVCNLCGCALVELATPEKPPHNEQLYESYNQIELKRSSSADVLTVINLPEHELLSQSTAVIASVGQKKKGYKSWFKMAAFDENEVPVQRKYIYIVDEKPRFMFVEPWANLRFNCEMILDEELLDRPYANENARRIAILKQVLKNTRKDIDDLGQDNETIDISGMLINQALETVLVKLDASPALAAQLSEPDGLRFEHTSFDKGKIKMFTAEEAVKIEVMLGSILKRRLDLSGGLKYKRGE
jgi:hypothetical protein